MTTFLKGRDCLLSRLKALATLQRFNHTLAEGGLQTKLYTEMGSDAVAEQSHIVDTSKWGKYNARYYGIDRFKIPPAAWTVLKILRNEGFEAYLVGGCVRDLILNKIPKDFDVITTAELTQIKNKFYRSAIIGQRFPICKVYIKGSEVEVSSFNTVANHPEEKEKVLLSQMPAGCDEKDFLLWRNSMHRDFTINSLFLDPFMFQIYDYANGMKDLRSRKLRTLVPAQLSFEEDCARILRGLRIAGRLGLSISKDTETAIRKLSSSITNLAKSRMMMELNYMLSYGAAESTICLLQRFNLLEIFLPFHAAYLNQQAGEKSAHSSMMLMKLFFYLDRIVSSDRPCDCSLWVGLLAFHQALVINPQDALVIWAFASVLYHGTWKEGVKFARDNAKVDVRFVPEISAFSEFKSNEELAEEVAQLASLVQHSVGAFIDASCLSNSMSRYPVSPCPGLVFVRRKTGNDVAQLLEVLVNDIESYDDRRKSFMINYSLLGKGNLHETRFVLGKVILETLSGGFVGGTEIVKEEPEVIEDDCNSTFSDLLKDQVVVNNDKKRILLPFDPEAKQEMAKKQKLVKVNCFSEQEITIKKKEVVLKDESQEPAKKHHKVIETSQLPVEELIMMQTSMLENKEFHLQQHQMSDKKHSTIEDEKDRDRAKKHMKAVREVKHLMLSNKKTKDELNVSGKGNDRIIKREEKTGSLLLLQELFKEKTQNLSRKMEKCKQELDKEKSDRPSLYSLFK